MTVIVVLIREVKATLRNSIYYYKDFGVDEVVDLTILQCVVGQIQDRDEWAIVDRSDNVDIQAILYTLPGIPCGIHTDYAE